MTINELFKEIKISLKQKAFITNPELEARIIITNVLNLSLTNFLLLQNSEILEIKKINLIKKMVNRRLKGESIASIVGKKEFWGYEFFVNKDVLIPRPETELLIEIFLEKIKNDNKLRVLDIGTGSGILSIILSNYYPDFIFYAIDKYKRALKVAKVNIKTHCKYKNVFLEQKDFFKYKPVFKFDIIISNPPYIPDKETKYLLKNKIVSDPEQSLNGGKDGLKFYKHLYYFANNFLNSNGIIIIEHGYKQQESIINIFSDYYIEKFKDFANNPRALYLIKQN